MITIILVTAIKCTVCVSTYSCFQPVSNYIENFNSVKHNEVALSFVLYIGDTQYKEFKPDQF